MDARPDKCATGEASLATIAAFALVEPLARLFGRWASQRNPPHASGAPSHFLSTWTGLKDFRCILASENFNGGHESWPRAGDLVPLTTLEHSFVSAT